MKEYTIAENFSLPSHGKVYDTEVSEIVTMSSMTTAQEQKRMMMTSYPYKMLCDIMDECIVNDIGISTYDMCIGDYQYLLHRLRVVTYGPDYEMDIKCPYCGSTNHEVINLDELPIIEYTEDFDKYRKFVLPKTEAEVEINIQTPRMLDEILEKTKEFKKKFPEGGDPTLTFTVASLIKTIDGKKQDPIKLEQWIRKMPMADTNVIISHAEKLNSLVGVNTNLFVTCNTCDLSHITSLKFNQEFFRPALKL